MDELSTLTIGSLVAAIAQAGILYLTYRDFSRALFILIVVVSFLLCILWRIIARIVFRLRKETLNITRNILVVGIGTDLLNIEKTVRKNSYGEPTRVHVLDLKKQTEFQDETPGSVRKPPH